MRVLWIINMILPNVANELGLKTSFSGGWLTDYADRLSKDDDIELATMTYANVPEDMDVNVNNIRCFIFKGAGKRLLFDSERTAKDCNKVIEKFKPDLIHLHGTEYAPAYYFARDHKDIKTFLTIQGVLSRISEEYYGGLSLGTILGIGSIKDWIKLKTPFLAKQLFKKNAKREKYVLKNVKYVSGRTLWDMSVMKEINPEVEYFRLNYNLRKSFYSGERWDIELAESHSIYTGAGQYPLKGLHVLIRAVGLLKKRYPDVRLYVPGSNAISGRLSAPNAYEMYLLKLIKKENLIDNVIFIGRKSDAEVIECLKKARVCVVPSAMEGASTTICEAMMTGTPCICSYRGGMTDLLVDGETGFTYDFPEFPVLAEKISIVFEDDELCLRFSKRSLANAKKRHNQQENYSVLKKIYSTIINER